MIEVEIKTVVRNREEIIEKLLQLGFQKEMQMKESDFYFDNESGDIRFSDKALRIRCCENLTTKKTESFMTYKGPKLDNVSMTRNEYEIEISNIETGMEILENLGYTSVYPVVKMRQYFKKGESRACLDQVENLGDFLELEIVVEDDRDRDKALDKIMLILQELGYEKKDVIRRSYLSMLQEEA